MTSTPPQNQISVAVLNKQKKNSDELNLFNDITLCEVKVK